jgi:hypothetical protein
MASFLFWTWIFTGDVTTVWTIMYTINILIPTCLNSGSHDHPFNKHAVLSTLVHRARALCDKDCLHDELVFLRDTFDQNS